LNLPLADETVNCVVTSPPYFGLRDYGVPGQLGLEFAPGEYVANLVEVFREVWRVLRPDGTVWLNLGDSYYNYRPGHYNDNRPHAFGRPREQNKPRGMPADPASCKRGVVIPGLKEKDLIGIPWRVALALQADGWWLRSDIIWSKTDPMPESVKDRVNRSHEYVFMLTKNKRYWYDGAAIGEPLAEASVKRYDLARSRASQTFGGGAEFAGDSSAISENPPGRYKGGQGRVRSRGDGPDHLIVGGKTNWRNARSVWTLPLEPFLGAHFATFPTALVKRCILAGCPPGGVVLDPFVGSGTTVFVAQGCGRVGIGLDLNLEYCRMAVERVGRLF
jgi:DNA modification methylase